MWKVGQGAVCRREGRGASADSCFDAAGRGNWGPFPLVVSHELKAKGPCVCAFSFCTRELLSVLVLHVLFPQAVMRIHVLEPEGDVLVFLTGQEEIEAMVGVG